MRKKIFPLVLLVLLLLAGIIALTQESDNFSPGSQTEAEDNAQADENGEDFPPNQELAAETYESYPEETPEWVKPARWFRSNAAGMPLEEIPSRLAAMRNEYVLVIDFAGPGEIPDFLIPYYKDEYFIENRTFYKQGEKFRIQWIFRDVNGTTRLLAVFPDTEDETPDGFIEVYGKDSALLSELRFYDNGERNKTEYFYNKGFMVRASAWQWEWEKEAPVSAKPGQNGKSGKDEADEGAKITKSAKADRPGDYKKLYTDYYHYNRSGFLRNVERVFHEEQLIKTSGDSLVAAFPSRIMDAARNDAFISENINVTPDYWEDAAAEKDDRIVYTADQRGRVITQTLFDKEDNVVWTINNTWTGDRIVSISKIEGETELLTEYEYDEAGNRVLERDLRNGVLERVVRTQGKIDYEELYLQGRVFLTAVWEDGRKISETRVRNN